MVGPEQVETLGARPDGTLAGMELEWPEAVPLEGERPEALVVIASDMPMDLRLLETAGHRITRVAGSSMEHLPRGYAVRRIWFWVKPRLLP